MLLLFALPLRFAAVEDDAVVVVVVVVMPVCGGGDAADTERDGEGDAERREDMDGEVGDGEEVREMEEDWVRMERWDFAGVDGAEGDSDADVRRWMMIDSIVSSYGSWNSVWKKGWAARFVEDGLGEGICVGDAFLFGV